MTGLDGTRQPHWPFSLIYKYMDVMKATTQQVALYIVSQRRKRFRKGNVLPETGRDAMKMQEKGKRKEICSKMSVWDGEEAKSDLL